jgi:hypothetical protein
LSNPVNHIFRDHHGLNPAMRRYVIHEVQHHLFQDRAYRPCPGLHHGCPAGDGFHRGVGKLEIDPFDLEEGLILSYQRVAGLGKHSNERRHIRV